MADTDIVGATAPQEKESADWRPFNVWASQVRAGQRNDGAAKERHAEAPREKWDPYAVWKRQVRQN